MADIIAGSGANGNPAPGGGGRISIFEKLPGPLEFKL
jgi:hypothetical protein